VGGGVGALHAANVMVAINKPINHLGIMLHLHLDTWLGDDFADAPELKALLGSSLPGGARLIGRESHEQAA
jgi:hypothetical protein